MLLKQIFLFFSQVSAFNASYSDSGLFGVYTISQAAAAGDVCLSNRTTSLSTSARLTRHKSCKTIRKKDIFKEKKRFDKVKIGKAAVLSSRFPYLSNQYQSQASLNA